MEYTYTDRQTDACTAGTSFHSFRQCRCFKKKKKTVPAWNVQSVLQHVVPNQPDSGCQFSRLNTRAHSACWTMLVPSPDTSTPFSTRVLYFKHEYTLQAVQLLSILTNLARLSDSDGPSNYVTYLIPRRKLYYTNAECPFTQRII
jgi:hypothetical protein